MIYILQFEFCPLTCMENQSDAEGPRSHVLGCVLENLSLQYSVGLWATTPHGQDIITS